MNNPQPNHPRGEAASGSAQAPLRKERGEAAGGNAQASQVPLRKETTKLTLQLHTGIALIPLIATLLLYTLILHARLTLGHWPQPNQPDPKQLTNIPIHIHATLTYIAIILTSLTPLAWTTLLTQTHYIPTLKPYLQRFALYLVNSALALTLARTDPGRCLQWLLD